MLILITGNESLSKNDHVGTKHHVGITELPQIKYKKVKQISSLREKCPSTEFFLVQIQENTDQKKLRIWALFTQCMF